MRLGLAPRTVPIVPYLRDRAIPADSSMFGYRCYVDGKVMGVPGPHDAVVIAILQSGRVLTHVFIPGGKGVRRLRVITDPSNVGLITTAFEEPQIHPLYAYYATLADLESAA